MKLPKIDVPTFDRNILHWTTFWEQFEVSIHSKPQHPNAEKLAYLRHALKGGTANQVIEGMSQSADQYEEAIGCLRKRYDIPRLTHCEHTRAILDTPSLKEGNGKGLRHVHDVDLALTSTSGNEERNN